MTQVASQHQPETGLLGSPRTLMFVLGFLIAISTVAVYWPVLKFPFLSFDDQIYVYENVHVTSGLHWDTVKWAFTTYDAANWHPLTWLSHALDCQLFLLNPARHHAVNVFVHTLNVLLLFWVLQSATRYVGRSAMVAALFALHPINVESVAWIAERKNLLSMVFFLLALGAYRRYSLKPGVARYALVAVLYGLGLMAKPQVITLPGVLLLWDYWPLQRMFAARQELSAEPGTALNPGTSFFWLVLEKIPLFVLSAASAVMTMKAQRAGYEMKWYPRSVRLENAIVAYASYVKKAFWPSNLTPMYPHPGHSLPAWQVLVAFLFLLTITALIITQWRRRYLLVGWFWFLGTLVPMIGLVQVGTQAMADRYAYLSFIGLFIMVCWAAADLFSSWRHADRPLQPRQPTGRRSLSEILQWGLSITVLVTLAALTHRQVAYWSDDVALWSHAVTITNKNWVAEDYLGVALTRLGRRQEAQAHFFKVIETQPTDALANLSIGEYETQTDNRTRAIERFQTVVKSDIQPESRARAIKAQAYTDLGYAYGDLGDYQRSGQSFAAAGRLNPGQFDAWMGLGIMAQKVGKLDLAVKAYSQAMTIEPVDWGYLLLAGALQQSGRMNEAQSATRQAESLSLDLDEAKRVANQKLGR